MWVYGSSYAAYSALSGTLHAKNGLLQAPVGFQSKTDICRIHHVSCMSACTAALAMCMLIKVFILFMLVASMGQLQRLTRPKK